MRGITEGNDMSINNAGSVTKDDHLDTFADVGNEEESTTVSVHASRKEKTLREKNIFAKNETRNIN
jgi:hypothetical protein